MGSRESDVAAVALENGMPHFPPRAGAMEARVPLNSISLSDAKRSVVHSSLLPLDATIMSADGRENIVDIDALRVELKSWENAFKQEYGRKPGRADIKNDATIGWFSCNWGDIT